MRTAHDIKEIKKARSYVTRCEDLVTSAMHCSNDEFREATRELRRAQIRLARLEAKK